MYNVHDKCKNKCVYMYMYMYIYIFKIRAITDCFLRKKKKARNNYIVLIVFYFYKNIDTGDLLIFVLKIVC